MKPYWILVLLPACTTYVYQAAPSERDIQVHDVQAAPEPSVVASAAQTSRSWTALAQQADCAAPERADAGIPERPDAAPLADAALPLEAAALPEAAPPVADAAIPAMDAGTPAYTLNCHGLMYQPPGGAETTENNVRAEVLPSFQISGRWELRIYSRLLAAYENTWEPYGYLAGDTPTSFSAAYVGTANIVNGVLSANIHGGRNGGSGDDLILISVDCN